MASSAENTTKIATLNTALTLYATAGAVITLAFASIFTGFLTWYLPKELQGQQTEILAKIQIEIDKIAKLQLDKLAVQAADAQRGRVKGNPKAVQRLAADAVALLDSPNRDV